MFEPIWAAIEHIRRRLTSVDVRLAAIDNRLDFIGDDPKVAEAVRCERDILRNLQAAEAWLASFPPEPGGDDALETIGKAVAEANGRLLEVLALLREMAASSAHRAVVDPRVAEAEREAVAGRSVGCEDALAEAIRRYKKYPGPVVVMGDPPPSAVKAAAVSSPTAGGLVQWPTIGRVVHYVLPDGSLNAGKHRAAMIVAVAEGGAINLSVFAGDNADFRGTAGDLIRNDLVRNLYVSPAVALIAGAAYSAGHEPGTWHWPEREGG